MAIIDLTPAQVATATSTTAQRTPPAIVSPPWNGANRLHIYRAGDGTWHCVVHWDGELEQDVVIATYVPPAELSVLQTALQRVLMGARQQAGAT